MLKAKWMTKWEKNLWVTRFILRRNFFRLIIFLVGINLTYKKVAGWGRNTANDGYSLHQNIKDTGMLSCKFWRSMHLDVNVTYLIQSIAFVFYFIWFLIILHYQKYNKYIFLKLSSFFKQCYKIKITNKQTYQK